MSVPHSTVAARKPLWRYSCGQSGKTALQWTPPRSCLNLGTEPHAGSLKPILGNSSFQLSEDVWSNNPYSTCIRALWVILPCRLTQPCSNQTENRELVYSVSSKEMAELTRMLSSWTETSPPDKEFSLKGWHFLSKKLPYAEWNMGKSSLKWWKISSREQFFPSLIMNSQFWVKWLG